MLPPSALLIVLCVQGQTIALQARVRQDTQTPNPGLNMPARLREVWRGKHPNAHNIQTASKAVYMYVCFFCVCIHIHEMLYIYLYIYI